MSHWEDEKQTNTERAAEIKARREKNPDHYKKIAPSKTKQYEKLGKYMSQSESRAHKVLDTWFKNRETQQNFATGKSEIPTAAERKTELEKQQNKKIKVDETTDCAASPSKGDTMNQPKKGKRLVDLTKDNKKDDAVLTKEAVDKEHPIYKEYQGLKNHDIKTLRDIIKRQHRIVDTSEFRTKEHAISHILHNKHGSKRMAAVFGESATYTMASKKTPKVSSTVAAAKDTNHRQMNNLVHGREGGVHASEKSFKKEDVDMDTFISIIESWETEKKKQRLRDALDRHTEKALAANRAGDDEATKVHQQYMNKIKGQMAKLARNESVEDIYDATDNQLDEISKATLSSYASKAFQNAGDLTYDAAHTRDKDEKKALKDKAAKRLAGIKTADAKLKEEAELAEAWNKSNRNPQRGIKVGHKVRSYDFPGMHDSHYIEGHVVGETPSSYHIKVSRVVRDNKEIPTPAHMHHVEAPKGKSIWTDAYAVHKLNNKLQTEQAVAPVEKNYYKGIRLHFAKGNRGGKSSSNKGGAADGGNGGSGGGAGGGGDGA